MSDLTEENRDELIQRLSLTSGRLVQVPDGAARDELQAEVRQLAKLLWRDEKPEQ